MCVCAVLGSMSVQEHAGNEKSCLWHAPDYADGELKDELFAIRFASAESEQNVLLALLIVAVVACINV